MTDLRSIKAYKMKAGEQKTAPAKPSLIISFILHLALLLLAIIGLPLIGKKIIDSPHVIVEIMPIAPENNLDHKKVEEPKPKEKDAPKSAPPSPPEPKIEEKKPQEKIEEKPKLAKHEEKKKPEPIKPEKNIVEKPKEKKLVKEKEEKKVLDKKNIDDYESLLKNIKDSSEKKTESTNKSKNYSKINDYDKNKTLSITTENDIKRQLYACWSPPSGAKNAKDMAVVVRIKFAKDGSVVEASHVDHGMFSGNQFYNAAVAAALRAVWKCSPLNIPKNEYENWKEIEFNFDPSSIIY